MPNTDPVLLAKLERTVEVAHDAFNNCPPGDPLKPQYALQRNQADNAFLRAINTGLEGNAPAIQQAAHGLDMANEAVSDALDATRTTTEVLTVLRQAVGFAIQLVHLASVVAV